MSSSSTPAPEEDENYKQHKQKLKEKFSTLTHDEKYKAEFGIDKEEMPPEIKPDETKGNEST